MSHRKFAATRRFALAAALLAAGCNFVKEQSASTLGARDGSLIGSDSVTGDSKLKQPPAAKDALGETDDTTRLLADSEWVQRIASSAAAGATSATPARRWRHAGLESLLAGNDARPRLRAAVKSGDAAVAASAAIGLAWLGDASVLPRLVKAAHDFTLKLPARGAAIEAIGGLATAKADEALEELLAGFGDCRGAARPRYLPELHADLIRAISGRDPNRHVEALRTALSSPASNVRLEAIKALGHLQLRPPRELLDCAADQSSAVRAAAILALADAQHEEAQACAWRGLSDYDLSVRLAAIEALGGLPDANNTARLRALADDSADTIRAAAVKALARLGERAAIVQAAKDDSWRVRAVVAESIGTLGIEDRETLARAFLTDASLEVQRRMVSALAAWPLEAAVPLLLSAVESPTAAVRRDAAEQLQNRWPPAADLSPQSPRERMAADAARLREIWQSTPAFQGRRRESTASEGRRTSAPQGAAREFATIELLAAYAAHDRRAAARQLADEYRERALPEAALSRIAKLVEREADALVWNDVLSLIARDDRAPAADIAAIAASHESADVRRRACAYFALHASPRAAGVLHNSLTDKDMTVVREALRGLANQRTLPDARSLEPLLTSPDSGVRVEAAAALARHGSPAGLRGLLRQSHHQDPIVRRQAAAALGDAFQLSEAATNDLFNDSLRNAAIGELVRLLDDNGDVRRAALDSLQRVARDPPPEVADSAEQVRRWKMWRTARNGGF